MTSPIGPDGKIANGYRVKASLSAATCSGGSEVIGSVGYRCFAEDIVADPCWEEGSARVLCLAEPWSMEVIRLMVSSRLPERPVREAQSAPWAVEVDGNRCLAAQGAHDNVGEDVVDYLCSGDLAILRGIDRSAPVWQAKAARSTVAGTYERLPERVSITTAWFGKARR